RIVKPQPRERSRCHVFDEHIGFRDHPAQQRFALLGLEVEGDAALVEVVVDEIMRVGLRPVREPPSSRLAAIWLLDFHDLGAEPCQGLGARGTRLELREVEDLDALQRRGRGARGFLCGCRVLHGVRSRVAVHSCIPVRPRPLPTPEAMLASRRSVDDIAGDRAGVCSAKERVVPEATAGLTTARSLGQIAGADTRAALLEGLAMGGFLSCGRWVGPRGISGGISGSISGSISWAAPAGEGIKAAYQRVAALLVAFLFWSCAAVAQQPGQAITIIVPYTPGTGPDTLARLLGEEIQARWHQTVVVENKPGASGNIGTQVAARAPADGSMLLLAASPFTQ